MVKRRVLLLSYVGFSFSSVLEISLARENEWVDRCMHVFQARRRWSLLLYFNTIDDATGGILRAFCSSLTAMLQSNNACA